MWISLHWMKYKYFSVHVALNLIGSTIAKQYLFYANTAPLVLSIFVYKRVFLKNSKYEILSGVNSSYIIVTRCSFLSLHVH